VVILVVGVADNACREGIILFPLKEYVSGEKTLHIAYCNFQK
jgi:hypothetical protein